MQVVGAVAVEVNRAACLSSTSTSGSSEMSRSDLLPGVELRLVLLRLLERLALQCRDLHSRERRLLLVLAVALRVLAVGHLQAAEDLGAVRRRAR